MTKEFFKQQEKRAVGLEIGLQEFLHELSFNSDDLIPVISQQHSDKTVLMMAWMNREAIEKTLMTGRVCYWSRSRQKFWFKGEESGHTQELVSMQVDCDGDCLLLQVKQVGGACHTQRQHCFYWHIDAKTKMARIVEQ